MIIHRMRCGGGVAKFLYNNRDLKAHADLVRVGNYTLAEYVLLGYRLSKNDGKPIETYSYRTFNGKIHCFHRIYRKEYVK